MIRTEGCWRGRKVGLGVISETQIGEGRVRRPAEKAAGWRLYLPPEWVLSCLCSGTPSAYVTGQGYHLWTTAKNHSAVYSQRKLRLGHSQMGTSATHSSCFVPFKYLGQGRFVFKIRTTILNHQVHRLKSIHIQTRKRTSCLLLETLLQMHSNKV